MSIKMFTPDVGQAMSSMICNEKGQAVLFDTANTQNGEQLSSILAKEQVKQVKVIISHEHDDHINGLLEMVKDFSNNLAFDEIYLSDDYSNEEKVNELRKWLYIRESVQNNKDINRNLSQEVIDAIYGQWDERKYYIDHSSKAVQTKQFNSVITLIQNGETQKADKLVKKWCIKQGIEPLDFYKKMAKTSYVSNKTKYKEKVIRLNKTQTKKVELYNMGYANIYRVEPTEFKNYYEDVYAHDNNLVSIVHLNNDVKMCFPGDASVELLRTLLKNERFVKDAKDCQILILPHHGSINNYLEEFAKTVNPEIIVSQAMFAVYGHPSEYVVYNYERVADARCATTESVGNLCFDIKGIDETYMRAENLAFIVALGPNTKIYGENVEKEMKAELEEELKQYTSLEKTDSKFLKVLIDESKEELDSFLSYEKIEQINKYLNNNEKIQFIQSFNTRAGFYDNLPDEIEIKLLNSKVGREFVEKYNELKNEYNKSLKEQEEMENSLIDISKIKEQIFDNEVKKVKNVNKQVSKVCEKYIKLKETVKEFYEKGIKIQNKEQLDLFFKEGKLRNFENIQDFYKFIKDFDDLKRNENSSVAKT